MSKARGRADLLVEVGTEELPPAALRKLSEAFASGLAEALTTAGLVENPTATPLQAQGDLRCASVALPGKRLIRKVSGGVLP